MKTLSVIILSLFVGLFLAIDTNAQEQIKFAKGKSFKTMKVTVPAGESKSFSLNTGSEQVINVDLSGDIFTPKMKDGSQMPVISLSLSNPAENLDNWQDGEGYLSVYTGKKGKYVFEVFNSDFKDRTFTMKVAVTKDFDDYRGGIDSP